MNYLFFGTPDFAAIILEKLVKAGLPPSFVVCNPDKPVGRKHVITPPLTKLLAIKYNIPILQPEVLSISNFSRSAESRPAGQFPISNFDFFIVAAYAKIIPKEILKLPRLGTIGVHPSLLPKYRGSSPIQSAILNGEKETGVTLFLIDKKVDHGSILAKRELEFSIFNFQFPILSQKLAELGADLLIETLPKFVKGEITPLPQDESKATYTRKFITEDGYIEPKDLERAQKDGGQIAIEIDRKIRALNPEPGVWTTLNPAEISSLIQPNGSIKSKKRIKLLEAKIIDEKLKITKIQVEGGKPQNICRVV